MAWEQTDNFSVETFRNLSQCEMSTKYSVHIWSQKLWDLSLIPRVYLHVQWLSCVILFSYRTESFQSKSTIGGNQFVLFVTSRPAGCPVSCRIAPVLSQKVGEQEACQAGAQGVCFVECTKGAQKGAWHFRQDVSCVVSCHVAFHPRGHVPLV